jgi:two-component system nitrogen regulation sensor histidine kinase GlnL
MPLFETILNSLDEAVLLFNKRGRLLYLNKAGEELFGSRLRDLKDKGLTVLFAKPCDLSDLLRRAISEGRSYRGRDIELLGLKDTNMDVYICPIYDESLDLNPGPKVTKPHYERQPKGALLCLRENQYLADTEDYQFDSLLYLLGSIAHEIKNPLSGIKGAAQLLSVKMPELQNDECIKMILRETERLNGVLHSYLTITRGPVFNRLNIHEALEHALKVLSPLIKEGDLKLIKSYDPSLPDILGDESKLLQVFINLIKNSVEALQERKSGREIRISTRLSNEYMLIYDSKGCSKRPHPSKRQRWIIVNISDNGAGIDTEEQKRIFLPFYTKKRGGTGLGLSLSKKIIKDHGGIIRVKSQIGKGALFSVYLPVSVETGND